MSEIKETDLVSAILGHVAKGHFRGVVSTTVVDYYDFICELSVFRLGEEERRKGGREGGQCWRDEEGERERGECVSE